MMASNDEEAPRLHSDGLHGYISYQTAPGRDRAAYSAGIGFYSAVWALIDQPLAGFQIALPGCWILPDNSDNKDRPLAPEGTLARTWKERLQKLVEGMHAHWTIDREYMAPPTSGSLVRLDPALIVTPPKGRERGYVPIVVGQRGQGKPRR